MPVPIATISCIVARLTALVFIIPGVSSRVISLRMRALLVCLLASAVVSIVKLDGDVPTFASQHFVFCIVHELVVGLSLGLAPAALVWGLSMAANSIHGMTGLPSGPTALDDGMGPLPHFLTVLATSLFFVAGGHRHVVQAVMISFEWLPPGHVVPVESARELLLDVLSQSFALGVRAMAPIGIALFMSLMALSVVQRVMPQIGYFVIGTSVQNLVLLGSLITCLGGIGWLLETQFQAIVGLSAGWHFAGAP